MTPHKLNYYLIVFQDLFLYFLSLSLSIAKEAEEQRDIVWEDVGCTGVTRPAL
jgi:steroid 5-alpha reductase family enzyme